MYKFFKIALFVTLIPFIITCKGRHVEKITEQSSVAIDTAQGKAEIEFVNDMHDFGEIQEGEVVKYSFEFKNTGKVPLIVTQVSASCGCTVADYPKHAINKGKSGTIDVKFDSKGRKGMQAKTITVFTNTTARINVLRLQANIN